MRDLYQGWLKMEEVVVRQHNEVRGKLLIEYAGDTIAVQAPEGGMARQAQLFAAVPGASNCAFAEAARTQGPPDRISSHVLAFEFPTGVPGIVAADNL